jgi:uncharacterized protein
MPWLSVHSDHLKMQVRVQPKSSRNRVDGIHGDAVKVHITAPPVEGAANKMCLKVLSDFLNVSPALLSIALGHTGRQKQIKISVPNGDPKKMAEEIRVRIREIPRKN